MASPEALRRVELSRVHFEVREFGWMGASDIVERICGDVFRLPFANKAVGVEEILLVNIVDTGLRSKDFLRFGSLTG